MIDMNLISLFHDNIGHTLSVVTEKIPDPPTHKLFEIPKNGHWSCCRVDRVAPLITIYSSDSTDQNFKNKLIFLPNPDELVLFLNGLRNYLSLVEKACGEKEAKGAFGPFGKVYHPTWFLGETMVGKMFNSFHQSTYEIESNVESYGFDTQNGWWVGAKMKQVELFTMDIAKPISFASKSHPVLSYNWNASTVPYKDGHASPTVFNHDSLWPDKKIGRHLQIGVCSWIPTLTPAHAFDPNTKLAASKQFLTQKSKWKPGPAQELNGMPITNVDLNFEYNHSSCLICAETDYVHDTGYIVSQLEDFYS
jgi:hypothetical protein